MKKSFWLASQRLFTKAYNHKPARCWAVFSVIILYILALTLPQIQSLSLVLGSSYFNLAQKLSLVFKLLGNIAGNYTWFSGLIMLLTILLGSANVLLFTWQLHTKQNTNKQARKGALATIISLLGAGCAACGGALLAPLLAAVGATGFLAILPGHGIEFGLLGLIILTWITLTTLKKIQKPKVCQS